MGNDKEGKKQEENKALAKSEEASLEKSSTPEGIVEDLISEIEEMPAEVVQQFRTFLAMFSRSSSGPRPHPLFEKFKDEHIDKYLDYVQRDDDHEYDLKRTNRWFYLFYAVVAIAVFILAVVYLLPRDKELLQTLIQLIVVLGGGIGAGYGLSKRNN